MKALVREVSPSRRHGRPHFSVTVEIDAPATKEVDGKDVDIDYSDLEKLSTPVLGADGVARHTLIEIALPEGKAVVRKAKHDPADLEERSKPAAPSEVAK